MFSSDGDWALFYFNGGWAVVQDWTASPAINGADLAPRIGVFVQGSTFRVFFNDQPVGVVTDVQFFAQEGGFGLVAATSPEDDGVLIAYVDNLAVTTPPRPWRDGEPATRSTALPRVIGGRRCAPIGPRAPDAYGALPQSLPRSRAIILWEGISLWYSLDGKLSRAGARGALRRFRAVRNGDTSPLRRELLRARSPPTATLRVYRPVRAEKVVLLGCR